MAIGLGIIGALSIIRFRTSLNDPRNITFMFASLGSGIACGVMGFGIAATGTLVFCLGAIILRLSPLSDNNELIGILRLRVPKEEGFQKAIEQRLQLFCKGFELGRLRFFTSKKGSPLPEGEIPATDTSERIRLQEFMYHIRLKNATTIPALEENMRTINGLEDLRLEFQKQSTKL